MKTRIVEASNGGNWGKFMVAKYDHEWSRRSVMEQQPNIPLLSLIGQGHETVWVLDLQTCEGAAFTPGGYAAADLEKHRIWVCPLFGTFLQWLYTQDLATAFDALPESVELPDAPFSLYGYRRKGPM